MGTYSIPLVQIRSNMSRASTKIKTPASVMRGFLFQMLDSSINFHPADWIDWQQNLKCPEISPHSSLCKFQFSNPASIQPSRRTFPNTHRLRKQQGPETFVFSFSAKINCCIWGSTLPAMMPLALFWTQPIRHVIFLGLHTWRTYPLPKTTAERNLMHGRRTWVKLSFLAELRRPPPLPQAEPQENHVWIFSCL